MNAVGRAKGDDRRSRTLFLLILFSISVCFSWLPTVFRIIFTKILGLEIFLKNCKNIENVSNFFLWMRSGSITKNAFKASRERSAAHRFNIIAVDRTYSSPILNPVLYSLISKRFRKKLKSICTERSSQQASSRTTRFRLSTSSFL